MNSELEKKAQIDALPVIFVRHKMDQTEETNNFLNSSGMLAVHYGNSKSTKPEDYKKPGKDVINRMNWRGKKGFIGVGYYNQFKPNCMSIGIVPPGSKIQIETRTVPDYEVKKEKRWQRYPNQECHYKYLQMEDYFEVDLGKTRQLEACLTRGGGVFVNWSVNEVDRLVRYLLKRNLNLIEERDATVFDLSSTQLEVLCSEFMRNSNSEYRIEQFTSPIGRTMSGTDIDGVNNNGYVHAQVSFSSDDSVVKDKIEKLRKNYNSENSQLVYFGLESKRNLTTNEVKYISIENVFETMKNSLVLHSFLD
jgi:hypothetical protein